MMRDPARIERICDKLKTVWADTPDWRFGQLVVNYLGRDPFYIEDDKFEELLDGIIDVLQHPEKLEEKEEDL